MNAADQQARIAGCLQTISPFSDAVQAALQQLGERPVDIDKACGTLELDPILAAAVLRLANSSFYGFARKIGSVKDACVLLGVHTLRQVVIAYSMVAAFPPNKQGALDRDQLWRHSIAVAVAAKLVAGQCDVDGDEALVAGILHDIGQFIIDQCLPAGEPPQPGIDHGRVGALAIEHWKLPPELARVAAYHHYPAVDRLGHKLVDVVHLANVLALGIWIPMTEAPRMEQLSPSVMTRLGLSWSQVEALLPQIDSISREMTDRLLP